MSEAALPMIYFASSSRMGKIRHFMRRFLTLMHIFGFSPLLPQERADGNRKEAKKMYG